ncbi:helix-turn-helix domain-containing protein [Streptomyces sp. TRM64462]|uniref:helix-turn-helix domain-containing protein n=1 Tax=Streptomyces sp. TRM64462 TaxID=2741726 RepID=UPI0020C81C80|nr:helix-turn-helix domain-containing protein [Streptomyces sp. TRM64462]
MPADPAPSPRATGGDARLPRLYRPEEIADVLGCSAWWVKDRARRSLIPHTRVGRAYRFTAEHLAEIVRMHEERPARNPQSPSSTAVPTPKPAARQRTETAVPTARLTARPPRRMVRSHYGTAA